MKKVLKNRVWGDEKKIDSSKGIEAEKNMGEIEKIRGEREKIRENMNKSS